MAFWITLWKVVFIVTVVVFAGLAVWVTIQGARDIKAMLLTLRKRHETDGEAVVKDEPNGA
ncbi:MAG TPA: hypothetical protein HPP77_02225 [Candidatus Hydrogenedentes bacterium]|nr:hypothetical protein [Candidatus Hydrogenedentota bacterium]